MTCIPFVIEVRMHPATRLSLLALASLMSSNTFAQTYPSSWSPNRSARLVEDRFRLEVGVLPISIDTQVRFDPSETVTGTHIDAESDLGLRNSKVLPQLEFTMFPGKHHLVRLSAFTVRRSAQERIDRQIVFDDQVYQANELVDSELNLSLVGLTYGYRFIASERAELAATLGIHITEVEANAVVRSRVIREAEDGVIPIPLFGVEGRFAFSSRWSAELRAQYLGGKEQDIDAFISDVRGAFSWRQNPHLVWGLGYRSFKIKVDSRDPDDSGRVDMHFDGPELFVRASL
jgi:hypothetical protein